MIRKEYKMIKNIMIAGMVLAGLVGCGFEGAKGNGEKGPTHVGIRSEVALLNHHDEILHDSDKVQIESVSSITTNGTVVDIALSSDGNVAYLASGEGGLEVIDISNPERPRLIYSYDLPEYINYVQVDNNRLYAANLYQSTARYSKLYAFELYDRYQPQYTGYAQAQYGVGHSRVKKGDYLYEVGQEGLQIHKSVRSIYYAVGEYYLHGSSYAVAVRGDYIFVANGRGGLRILKAHVFKSHGKVKA
jgi:hypothetical protein